MNLFWLDASALAKRYVPETGTPQMNHLFEQVSPLSLISLLEGTGEVTATHRTIRSFAGCARRRLQ
jgi:predicted nucleic acid-binding protein